MRDSLPIQLVVEDALSEAALRKILIHVDRDFSVGVCYGKRGFGFIKRNIQGFNQAAKGMSFLVLTDLDTADCPPLLIRDWLPAPQNPNLMFRIAVREVEAWLLADREGFAGFLNISTANMPMDVEAVQDPKRALVNLAKKCKSRSIRDAIVPRLGVTAIQGPDYNGTLMRFVRDHWDVSRASKHSDSLARTVRAVKNFKPLTRG